MGNRTSRDAGLLREGDRGLRRGWYAVGGFAIQQMVISNANLPPLLPWPALLPLTTAGLASWSGILLEVSPLSPVPGIHTTKRHEGIAAEALAETAVTW